MCYPKPGPRCASSSLKRLQKIVDNRGQHSNEEYEAALFDYYSTPAGMALFELKEKQDSDLIGHVVVPIAEYKPLLEAYRQKKLNAIKEGDKDTVHHYERIQTTDFLPDDAVRGTATAEEFEAYKEESIGFVNSIPQEAFVPLRWITSDGSSVLNPYLAGGPELAAKKSYKFRNALEDGETESFYAEKNVEHCIKTISDFIASHKRDEPVVVYRGIGDGVFSEDFDKNSHSGDPSLMQEVEEKFVPGEVFEMKNFAATTADPTKAVSFARSNVVFEMKARSIIPLGGISNWGFGEREMLAKEGTRYRITAVKKAHYALRNENTDEMIVVQMEEID